jgi:putative ABC transport system permease protein
MLTYYARLALKDLASTPGLTVLMVLAIGLGIGVSTTILTIYEAASGNPIWWKNDQLYAVTMDSWARDRPADLTLPHLPPTQLTYMDATYLADSLAASDIAARKVIMYPINGVVSGGSGEEHSIQTRTRVTSADFFQMFDVPFQHGSGWNAAADAAPEPVIVLSRAVNDKLFAGESGGGRTVRWNDHAFRVIGVLGDWRPLPKFYDLNSGSFDDPEDAYIPWGWSRALGLLTSGTVQCWKPALQNSPPGELGPGRSPEPDRRHPKGCPTIRAPPDGCGRSTARWWHRFPGVPWLKP